MLELKDVSKSFGSNEVLKNINLNIENGEIVSLLGPSGCGKTTLLNLILGLEHVTSGRIIFNNQEIQEKSMQKRGFNIVFQDFCLFPHLDAFNNIIYGLKNQKKDPHSKEVTDLIELLELRPHLRKKIHELSGGQKQRVSIARTVVMEPKILLMDEPLSALDGVIKESIKDMIQKVSKSMGLTTIIVTHDPEEALTMSDKVVVIEDGQIAQFGTPSEIIYSPANAFVEKFIINQLRIKRGNIYRLFGENYGA
ncbi:MULTISPECIES: ABC transporter ATP-binding protein [unclassified Staphylococcus]|uniref:ABC transporter ATP-binding protein n=1 Tax=unclassified Staphylococcus TaxID=91994 RepID=UPI00187F14E0|nr:MULTISPECIES: ABC transporter ATP-binding protein [unclassified Staphylococcus]MBF2758168.1 ABC transporter ATP-binding protein [Staphylococcus haemolyticus]MBF2774761.1 ABC transporter ATP-binding protein [Staphylococcus haemolyticus]MBF2777286.1 ABC transporter ATP-binding protein [Staphylococcus haemolyticus]MBF2816133.1 ABC transporter ATP-binding protein [Staphylococcus haemolyticus]MBF9720401.1 ABC transporter ATP-binding protein [Staphylococcus haemolyticus]